MPNLSFKQQSLKVGTFILDTSNDNWRSYQLVQWLPAVLPNIHEWDCKIGLVKLKLQRGEGIKNVIW